jgi:hypothetical protein
MWGLRPDFYYCQTLRVCWGRALSLTRRRVCLLQLLLPIVIAVILGSKSSGNHDQILLSQIRGSPNLEGQAPVFISPGNMVNQLYSQAQGSLFIAFCDLQEYHCLGILHTYMDAARTRTTEGTCHVFAIKPVDWCAGCTYRKLVTWPLLIVMWRHRGHKENTAPVLLAAYVLRALPSNAFTCHNKYYKEENNSIGFIVTPPSLQWTYGKI